MFTPEQWGAVEIFSKFHAETYKLSDIERRALNGVGNHFSKAITFRTLAHEIAPNLEIERQELAARGFSPATHSRQLSAVIEASILELYSAVDCAAKVVIGIYRKRHVRGLKNSTRKLFWSSDKIKGDFPAEMGSILKAASWFDELVFLRDELTHLETGMCNFDDKTSTISYMHTGIRTGDRALIIEDIFVWLETMIQAINNFLGATFRHFNKQLNSIPIPVVCGMTSGRILMRRVDPTQPLTFDSGTCESFVWFEKPENPTCPFAQKCGAYPKSHLLSESKSTDYS